MSDRLVLGKVEVNILSKNNKPVETLIEGLGDYDDPFSVVLNAHKIEKLYHFLKTNFIERI